jgi:hypothetical protein
VEDTADPRHQASMGLQTDQEARKEDHADDEPLEG